MKSWRILGLVCGFILLTFLGVARSQEKYPIRPIELVVPMGQGGNNDLAARIYGEELSRHLKVRIIVVNRPGGTGIEGASYVAKAKKDGYTLLNGSANSLITMPIVSKEATYDPLKDFSPLGYFASVPSIFAVKSDSPFKTLRELLEFALNNPGKLKSGSGGILSASQFNMDILCSRNKITIKTVPYISGGEALTSLLGGHVDLASLSLATLSPQIKAGNLRGLAIVSKTRGAGFPDIPTTSELGYPYVRLNTWTGAFAPAGVPKRALDILVSAMEKAFKNRQVVDRGTQMGFEVDYKDPKELRKFMEEEIAIVGKVAREANLIKK